MALKRKTKVTDSFSMASMTDVIFLLLIFFLVTSTIVAPNVIKVSLPSASASASDSQSSLRIVIDDEGGYYLGVDRAPEIPCTPTELERLVGLYAIEHPEAYVAIHADEHVPYVSVVKGINIASKAKLKVVLATKIEQD